MLFLLFLFGAGPFAMLDQAATTQDLPTIQRHQLGRIVLGADAQQMYEAFPGDRRRLVDLAYEGMLSPALSLTFQGTTQPQPDGVVAELACQERLVVWRIEVRDPAFRTEKGIGVGSTVGQLRAAYRLGAVLSGEGNVVIVSTNVGQLWTGPDGAGR